MSRRTLLGGLALSGPLLLLGCADGDEGPRPRAEPAESPTPPTPPPRLSEDTVMIAYGDGPQQFGHLDLPEGRPPATGWPVAVLIHGGFWRSGHSIDLMFDLARSLNEAGWATWNIQYSAVGDEGGGWPGTFLDVAAAVDHIGSIDEAPLDTERVLAVGHSAGGHLALWAAGRPNLPNGAAGADPAVSIGAVISQAGVTDLVACVDDDLGGGACSDLMGGRPDDDPDRYALASPIEQVPLGVPALLVHGDRDVVVPVAQSQRFVARAQWAEEDPTLLIVEGADHFAPIDASHEAWLKVREMIPQLIS